MRRIRKGMKLDPRKLHRWLLLQSGWKIMRAWFRAMKENIEQEGSMRNVVTKIRK